MPYILDNYWFIDKFFLMIKISESDNALVNFLFLVKPFLLLVFIVYIMDSLLGIIVFTWENKINVNIR